jgi:small subunit ribosomal protein S17
MAEKKQTTTKKEIKKTPISKVSKVSANNKKSVVSKSRVKKPASSVKKEVVKKAKVESTKKRRVIRATIVKDNSTKYKFLNVKVTRVVAHPLYRKLVKKNKKYLVSCPQDVEFKVGEEVFIEETNPISKRISFRYVSKV